MGVMLRAVTGVLSFNRNTYNRLGKPAAVYLFFSRVRDLIAIEPVQSLNMPAAFPVLEKGMSASHINAAPSSATSASASTPRSASSTPRSITEGWS